MWFAKEKIYFFAGDRRGKAADMLFSFVSILICLYRDAQSPTATMDRGLLHLPEWTCSRGVGNDDASLLWLCSTAEGMVLGRAPTMAVSSSESFNNGLNSLSSDSQTSQSMLMPPSNHLSWSSLWKRWILRSYTIDPRTAFRQTIRTLIFTVWHRSLAFFNV